MKLRRKLVKVVAVAVMSLMSVTSFASDLPLLTLNQAISSALGADASQQEVYEKSIAAARQTMQDMDDVATNAYQSSYYGKLEDEQTAKYHKDAIEYETTKLYNSIALLEKQVAFCDEKLAFQEKVFTQQEVKYKNGLLSKLDYDTAQSKIEEERTAKDKLQAQLDENRANFKILSKYDTKNYSLEQNFDVEYYHYVGNIQYFFSTEIDEMLQYQKKLAEVSNTYLFSDMMKRHDNSATTYYSGKANAAQAAHQVEAAKDSRLSTLNGLYSSLASTEQDIKELEVTVQDAEKTLTANKLKFEKGQVSQIEIDKAEIQLKEQQLNLTALKVKYNAAKDAVKKPWVSFY